MFFHRQHMIKSSQVVHHLRISQVHASLWHETQLMWDSPKAIVTIPKSSPFLVGFPQHPQSWLVGC